MNQANNDILQHKIQSRLINNNPSNNLGQKKKSFLENTDRNLTPKVDKAHILITPKSSLKKNAHLTEELYVDSLLKHPIIEEHEKKRNEANSRKKLYFHPNQNTKNISSFNESKLTKVKNYGGNSINNNIKNNKDLLCKQINISDSSDFEVSNDDGNSLISTKKMLKENEDPENKGRGISQKEGIQDRKIINDNTIQDKIIGNDKKDNNKMLNFFESYEELSKKKIINSIIKDRESDIDNNYNNIHIPREAKRDISDKASCMIKSEINNKNKIKEIDFSFNTNESINVKNDNEKEEEPLVDREKKTDNSFHQLEKSLSFRETNNYDKNHSGNEHEEIKEFDDELLSSNNTTTEKLNINNNKINFNLLLKLNSRNNDIKKVDSSESNKEGYLLDSDYIQNSVTRKNFDSKQLLEIMDIKKASNKNQFSLFDFNSQKSTNNFSTKRKLDVNYDSEVINEAIKNSQESFKNKCEEIKLSEDKIHKGVSLSKSKK